MWKDRTRKHRKIDQKTRKHRKIDQKTRKLNVTT